MNARKLLVPVVSTAVGFAVAVATVVVANPSETSMPEGHAQMPLPPGWTAEDMQACMIAGTPGEMHEHLLKGVGKWEGECTMWMYPGSEPVTSACASKVTPIMDGRFVKIEWSGDMPGMGPYSGLGINGFDNVSQKFVMIWLDNHSTGIMQGTGELSEDGMVTTWASTFNCPVTKKQAVMRDIETITGPDTKRFEMFSTDPKTGQEYKMMVIELERHKDVQY